MSDETTGQEEPAGAYHQVRDRVEPPETCPVDHEWSPLDDDYLANPYPIANRMREQTPVLFSERLGYVVVNSFDLIEQIFMDPDVYASVNVQDPVFPPAGEAAEVLAAEDFNPVAVMSNRPEPAHGRIRHYTRRGFNRQRLEKLKPYVRERSDELLDQMFGVDPPIDFVEAFAFPLPGQVLFRLLGFPPEDDAQIQDWSMNRLTYVWGDPEPEEEVRIAEQMLAYWRYVREFVAAKHEDPGDDYTSELLAAHDEDPEELTYREIESIIYGLSFAGHEPVTALICNGLLELLPRRDQWAQLCEDPSLISNAIEEIIRYESSQVSWRRITTTETELGGHTLAEGTPIFLNLAAANRDPDRFDDPDTFDIHRSDARRHISFGKGIHLCLGMQLAKMEAQVVFETLVERVPDLHLVEERPVLRDPNITFRVAQRLVVGW